MIKTATRELYAARIQRVQEYITDHLDDALDLPRLAELAYMSPYHFHRIYVAMMGETVAETVRRRRHYLAAIRLLTSDTPIRKIALDSGYASLPAFSRAFRATHGLTPSNYRLHGQLSCALYAATHSKPKDSVMFELNEVKITDQPAHKVIAVKHQGDYQTIGISFEKLMVWAAGKGLLNQPMRCFALYYDDPSSKPKEQLLSEACIAPLDVTGLEAKVDGEVKVLTIEAARCATLLFKGPYDQLDAPYRWLYDTWLPQSGEELAFSPPYEEYVNDARTTPPKELLTLICLPLKTPG